MSREVRRDPLTGEEVVLASERVVERRPSSAPASAEGCPFCPGHEAHTRPTIQAVERDGRWVARAFANRMPALVVEEQLEDRSTGPFQAVTGVGAHEVLVEAPEHRPLHALPVERTHDALSLAVSRLRDLRRDTRLVTLQWFRNEGLGAGASQAHPHAQIVGLPVIPQRILAIARRSQEHLERTGRRLLPDVLEAEHRDGRRVLFRDGPVTAFCPFAPRHPFEVWLVAENPGPGLADTTDDELAALSRAMHRASGAMRAAVGCDHVTTIALGAPEGPSRPPVGWHVRIAPRLTIPGGLEEATGASVHSVFPEEAARLLRIALERPGSQGASG